jgi:O-antigen/teichoic acid export membrane protein
MDFIKPAIARALSLNLAGVIAVFFAFLNYSYWSLAIKDSLAIIIYFVYLVVFSKIRFKWRFNKITANKLLDFGWKRNISRALQIIMFRSPLFIIGNIVGLRNLGFFSQAYYLVNLPITFFSPAIQTVGLSFYSKLQNEKNKICKVLNLSNYYITRIMFPISIVIILFPTGILGFLYGQKWLEASVHLRYLSLFMFLLPLYSSIEIVFLSLRELRAVIKIYFIPVLLLALGILLVFFTRSISILSITYSIILLTGSMYALFMLKNILNKIAFSSIVISVIILVFALFTVSFRNVSDFLKETPNIIIFITLILLYLIIFVSEYKKHIRNYKYITMLATNSKVNEKNN